MSKKVIANVASSVQKPEDVEVDTSLRPKRLGEYVGQEQIKENLNIFIQAAKNRKESLEHLIFHGPPGLGKTTISHIIASEMGVNIRCTSGPVITRAGDLAAILTNLEPGDILFIDEIHRLTHIVEEVLYPAMEEFKLDIMIGKGPSARSIRLDLPRFTLIGATTRAGLVSSPLRDRFGVSFRLDFYEEKDLQRIVERSALLLRIRIEPEGSLEIARRSRGTPRIANRLLRRVRDYAQVKGNGTVSKSVADQALTQLEVDDRGLDPMDRKLMLAILEKFQGGPVGLDNLAVAIGEEADTLEEVYEPFLIQAGFLQRTSQGRKATPLAYRHFGLVSSDRPLEQLRIDG